MYHLRVGVFLPNAKSVQLGLKGGPVDHPEGFPFQLSCRLPGAKHGRPLSNMALLMTLRRMGRSDLTVHGFRASFKLSFLLRRDVTR